MSQWAEIRSVLVPGAILPGQRANSTVRIPPSYEIPLEPAKRAVAVKKHRIVPAFRVRAVVGTQA